MQLENRRSLKNLPLQAVFLLIFLTGSTMYLTMCSGEKSPTPEPTPEVVPFGTDVVLVEETPTEESRLSDWIPSTSTPKPVSSTSRKDENCLDWCADPIKNGTGNKVGNIQFNCVETVSVGNKKISWHTGVNTNKFDEDRVGFMKTIFQINPDGSVNCAEERTSTWGSTDGGCPVEPRICP